MKSPAADDCGIIPFVKASACGNDFLIVEASAIEFNSVEPVQLANHLQALTRRMCDRHEGVGADGVEWVYFPVEKTSRRPEANRNAVAAGNLLIETGIQAGVADIVARLFNSDGSEAEISGNGTRCVAAHYLAQSEASKSPRDRISVLTGAGIKLCRLVSRRGNEFEFETEMGIPELHTALALDVGGRNKVKGLPISTGNPHFAVLVEDDEFPANWVETGKLIAKHAMFPHGTNVEFVKVEDRTRIAVRFFERGVGATQSSGTGSCAAAVAAIHCGRATSPLTVHSPGGAQTVVWDGSGSVLLRGPARIISEGKFFF